jgi:hypothetical protein
LAGRYWRAAILAARARPPDGRLASAEVGREEPVVWRVVGVLLALVVALSVIGLVIKAVRFLLIVAVVLAVLSAIAGMAARKKT